MVRTDYASAQDPSAKTIHLLSRVSKAIKSTTNGLISSDRRKSSTALPAVETSSKVTLLPSLSTSTPPGLGSSSQPIVVLPRWRRHSDGPSAQPILTTLDIVQESGRGRAHQIKPVVKGRRFGPLDAAGRASAKRCRQQKTVCIRCKKDRQPCITTNGGACSRCIHLGLTSKWRQPCTKASFLDIVENVTCNYISQRAVNHLTLDGQRRIRIDLPETLDLDNLLSKISSSQDLFDVRVRQGPELLYTLNLKQCHAYLSSMRKADSSVLRDLRGFIDRDILATGDWQDCVKDCSPLQSLMVSNATPFCHHTLQPK